MTVDPFQPSVPRKDELGRLLTTSTLLAGWPCRWCLRPLYRVWRDGQPLNDVFCSNCDNPTGECP